MDKLLIRGGNRLSGEITVSGAKNAAPVSYTHLTLPTIYSV